MGLKKIAQQVFGKKEPSGFDIFLKELKEVRAHQQQHGISRKIHGNNIVYGFGPGRKG